MATFEQDGGNFANQILGAGRTTQPKSKITGPVNAGPGSGVAPSHLAGVIKSKPPASESCIDVSAFLQRMQFKQYTGAASTGVGSNYNYGYVLSDTVPNGRYWEVLYADAIILGGSGTAVNRTGLWLLPPGQLPAPNSAPYQNNPDTFGNSGTAGTIANGGPLLRGIRVDEQADGISQDEFSINADVCLIRGRGRLFVPQGWTLMAWGGGYGVGNGGSLGEQYQLNILFGEMLLREDANI